MIRSLNSFDLKDKRVLIRVDYNVPIENGVVKDDIVYLSAMEETKYTIAQANTTLDNNNKIVGDLISCRFNNEFAICSFII